jgi:hypothetical protein
MTTAKKSSAKKSAKKSTPCWPGYEPVPGKEPRTKGSCKPKAKQTAAQRKADSKAAAASKLSKQS